ncbi:MAG: lipoyl(octanoyl) transferase [Dehalococcoidales bacterium]|jgi:lipoic acid synthetase|nr:lipoyl(octanoyl) transferase [Dehalococcoidales bacterium]MDP6576740.1 lipoyl(octanoyl) transferase LipB [Dehalococcoidales bacterium]
MNYVVYWLGLIDYQNAYHLQRKLFCNRRDGRIPDTLLLLEHLPTITVGKSGRLENILASREQLVQRGISLVFIDRGGDVTYHGPGQLVGYPIFDLKGWGRDAHRYIRNLEEAIIRTLNDFSIKSGRDRSHAGVWVKDKEIAAIGLSLSKWITMHGFALNVNTDLAQFSLINPCGFTNRRATSIAHLLGQEIPMAKVKERLLVHFAAVFHTDIAIGTDNPIKGHYERKTPTVV